MLNRGSIDFGQMLYARQSGVIATPAEYLNLIFNTGNYIALQAKLERDPTNLLSMRGAFNWTPIHYAVYYNDIRALDMLFWYGASKIVNQKDIKGAAPLIIAAQQGSFQIIESLLKNGADVYSSMPDWSTALHVACRTRNVRAINTFAMYPKLLNAADYNENTPIFYVADPQNALILKTLLNFGASLEAKNSENWTIFHTLCHSKNYNGFNIAIEALAKTNIKEPVYNWKNSGGCTPLHVAAVYCSLDFIMYFLKLPKVKNDVVNNDGCTILHLACRFNEQNVISYIANLNPVLLHEMDRCGNKPWDLLMCRDFGPQGSDFNNYFKALHYIKYGHETIDLETKSEVIQELYTRFFNVMRHNDIGGMLYFMEHKPSIILNFRDKYNSNALHVAALYSSPEIVALLLGITELRPFANKPTSRAVYPLHTAGQFSYPAVLQLLMQYTSYKVHDRRGCNVLHYACYGNNYSNVNYLLSNYPDLGESADSYGCTPVFHLCIKQVDSRQLLTYLNKSNIDFNLLSKIGSNLLHYACSAGNASAVTFLCNHFKDMISATSNDGHYPLHYACLNNQPEIVRILLQYGADIAISDRNNVKLIDDPRIKTQEFEAVYNLLRSHITSQALQIQ